MDIYDMGKKHSAVIKIVVRQLLQQIQQTFYPVRRNSYRIVLDKSIILTGRNTLFQGAVFCP